MREMEMKKSHSSVRILALFAYISVLIVSLSGCKDDKDGPSAHVGKISLSLSADTTSLKKGINSSVTKAVSDEFADFLTVEDYRILIVAGTDTAKQYDRFDKMPSEIQLPEGSYSLIASKGNNLPAGYENPYFEGSTDFVVKEGLESPLNVTSSLGNTRITLDCTDDFKAAYTDYSVGLKTAFTDSILVIKKDETRPAYLKVAKEGTDVSFAIKLKKVGQDEERTYSGATPLKLQRRQNVRLILKTDGEALEGIGLDVMLDDSLTTQSFTTQIPDFMWQQFDKPTLSADGFNDGEKLRVKTTVFDDDLRVGFVMRGGVNSLVVKHWKGDAEDEAEIIDLVAEPEKAKDKYFSWMVNENEFAPLKGTKAGYLILKNAIKSLKADKDESIEYHYKFYGKDNTGKEYSTNEINLTIIVEPAGAPFIQNFELPSEIVEGDELESMVETILAAEGEINEDKTTLTIESDGIKPSTYHLMKIEDRKAMYETHGIGIEIEVLTKLQMVFLKPFTTFLSAPEEGGSRSYTYKLHLEDKDGRVVEVTKTILVKAPVFNLLPSDNNGDAFARRILLNAEVLVGHPDLLSFQYRLMSGDKWINWKTAKYTKMNVNDVLLDLQPETSYQVRAIYRDNEDRVTEPITLTTESEVVLPDGKFDDWHSEEVYKKTISYLIGTTGIGINQWWPYVEKGSSWWDTRNNLTTSQRSGVSCYYTSYSGTIPVDGKNSGKAAEISTLGWGVGNTFTGSMTGVVIKNKHAGMLFIGSHQYQNGTESINYGHAFGSRPTKLKFDYKFKSINSERFKAYVVLENRDNGIVELGRGELISNADKNDFEEATVIIKYTNTNLKATHMYIVFISSIENNPSVGLSRGEIGTVNGFSDSRYVGNVLTVDNVELIYE